MAHPHPSAVPVRPLPGDPHQDWPASAYYAEAMQPPPGYAASSYHSSPEQAQLQSFVVNQQHPHDHFSASHATYAMQYSSTHPTSTPTEAHESHDWVASQQQMIHQQQLHQRQQQLQQQQLQQSQLQQQQQQQQHQSDEQHFTASAFADSGVHHHYSTLLAPAPMILAQPSNHSHFVPGPEDPVTGQAGSRSSLYTNASNVNATQMLFGLEQLQFQVDQGQPSTAQLSGGTMYQLNTTLTPQSSPDSPQSYRNSLEGAYTAPTVPEDYLHGYVYYPPQDHGLLQPHSFPQVGLDMLPTTSTVDGGQLSPSSSLSDHGYVVHTPDSLMSFAGTFENTAISNPGMPFHAGNASYTSQHSAHSITSASPQDIWQQPNPSSDAVLADETDDFVAVSQSMASSVTADDVDSSRGASTDEASWPQSPEATRTVAPTVRPHHRRRSSIVPNTATNGVQKSIAKKSGTKRDAQAQKALAEKMETTKLGRRKGPLTSDQRRQAGEIRKLKACIRCKFLKKTCDPNSPCAGCKPSHARLWMVPCTRLDIRELHYFMEDWKVDYERHVRKGITVTNIIDYAPQEQQIFIGHGFGDFMSISAREVYVRDDDIFHVDWVETIGERPETYEQPTSNLVIGRGGLSNKLLRDYLDRHVDRTFERFVEQMFEGTKVWTELLLAIYTLYQKTRNPMLRTALKFFVAYNLTQHITYEENAQPDSVGTIGDVGSTHTGKTLAPVLLNYEIKLALASMWRELHKSVLADLSTLFSSVYNGQKQKNWAMIMMLSSILLMVWEEMQFDSFYRMERSMNAVRFCHDMEAVPVGVITGLFSAISQKMPPLRDWDSAQHRQTFGGQEHENELCEAVEKARDILLKHDDYLKKRDKAQFDECDFDSLCNKFVHKILLRPAAVAA